MASPNHTLLVSFLLLLLASSLISITSSARCNSDDKRALLAIKAAFNNAYHFASWIPSTGCCDWYDVDCDPTTGRVIGLSIFQDANVTGTIPTAISSLPFLQTLILHHLPGLTGPIPPALSNLSHLKLLIMSFNSLSGPVPSFLSSLSSLTLLDLSFNSFSGSIPASLSLLPNLTSIDISRNHLTGPLPPVLFQHAPDLAYLRLSHNNLSGEIPISYSQIKFAQVDLSRNKFTGDATLLFGRDKPLELLDLSRNMFQFDLSKVVFPESGLDQVDLNHNMIYGSIPQQITAVPNLQLFNVSYNRLCGPIPTGGQLSRFDQYNYLHNKCLCGTPLPPFQKIPFEAAIGPLASPLPEISAPSTLPCITSLIIFFTVSSGRKATNLDRKFTLWSMLRPQSSLIRCTTTHHVSSLLTHQNQTSKQHSVRNSMSFRHNIC